MQRGIFTANLLSRKAVHSTLPAGKAYTTLELKLNIARALTDAVPPVTA